MAIITPDFSWETKELGEHETFLMNELDTAYLELEKNEIARLPKQFKGLDFSTPEAVSKSLVEYSYNNWIFAAKVFLGVDLIPFQGVVINELYGKPFYIIVASRGFGKTTRDCYVTTDTGFCMINDLFDTEDPFETRLPIDSNVLGENGFHSPEYKWKIKKQAVKIVTKTGNELVGSRIHPVRVVSNGSIEWKELSELSVGDRVVVDRNPSGDWYPNDNGIEEDLAYLFGCLVGDGGYTVRGRITITSEDDEMLEGTSKIAEKHFGKPFKKQKEEMTRLLCGVDIWDKLFSEYGFNSAKCGEKDFPKCILSAPKQSVAAFIRGLFDTDGCVNSKNGLWIEYASKSKSLVKTMQFVLSRFGIISRIKERENKKYGNSYHYLYIFGNNCKIFEREIGFGLKRKKDALSSVLDKKCNTNKDTLPHDLVLEKLLAVRNKYMENNCFGGHGPNRQRSLISPYRLKKYELSYETLKEILDLFSNCVECARMPEYKELVNTYNKGYFYDRVESIEDIGEQELYDLYFDEDDHSYLTNGFISHNSFLLAVYALLRAIFKQGSKIVIVSASFRQSMVVFNYIQDIFKRSTVLQQICGGSKPKKDISMCSFKIGTSEIISVPLGNGDKIRGLRANCILTDEFAALPEEIFQVVVRGFSVVSLDPVGKIKAKYREKELIEAGVDLEILDEESDDNQIILTGTAYYQFNHFYAWYKKYLSIIECGNDLDKLRKVVGEEVTDEELKLLSPEKFGVMRVPHYSLPYGYMDEGIIAQSKATMTKAHFDMEFGAEFYADSDGFFPRSLIEGSTMFQKYSVKLRGDKGKRYIMGVDPARQRDHFSIVLVELDESGERRHKIVYAWATNESKMKKSGEVNENQTYYGACAVKIRQLLKRFNICLIMMDAGGGGRSVADYLRERRFLKAGEQPIWEMDESSQNMYEGLHILKLISASSSWVKDANHSMRKSIEEFNLLFPIYDTIAIEAELNQFAAAQQNSIDKAINKVRNAMLDTVEDVSEEVEEMKNEISNIVVTATGMGNEHFDLPKLTQPGQKTQKDRRRKDRYSACVLAHDGIQYVISEDVETNYEVAGGTADGLAQNSACGSMYRGLPNNVTYVTQGDIQIVRKSGGGNIFI